MKADGFNFNTKKHIAFSFDLYQLRLAKCPIFDGETFKWICELQWMNRFLKKWIKKQNKKLTWIDALIGLIEDIPKLAQTYITLYNSR